MQNNLKKFEAKMKIFELSLSLFLHACSSLAKPLPVQGFKKLQQYKKLSGTRECTFGPIAYCFSL